LLELTLVRFTVDIDQNGPSSYTFVRSLEIIHETIEISLFGYSVTVEEESNLPVNVVFDELINDLEIRGIGVNTIRFQPIIDDVYEHFQFLLDSRRDIELFPTRNS
jgi:hypothetical protein